MKQFPWMAGGLGLALLAPNVAVAADSQQGPRDAPVSEPAPPDALRPGFGARVGGYGFRHEDGQGTWDDCQMNGFGVFGTLDYNRHLFGELGVDFYHAAPGVVEAGMDRISTHTLAGVGLRMLPDFVISPTAQLGGGVEWTRIEMGEAATSGVYPLGYIGLGAEVNATQHFKLGATFRMLLTAHPAHDASAHSHDTSEPPDAHVAGSVETEAELAAQAQFFLRYAL